MGRDTRVRRKLHTSIPPSPPRQTPAGGRGGPLQAAIHDASSRRGIRLGNPSADGLIADRLIADRLTADRLTFQKRDSHPLDRIRYEAAASLPQHLVWKFLRTVLQRSPTRPPGHRRNR